MPLLLQSLRSFVTRQTGNVAEDPNRATSVTVGRFVRIRRICSILPQTKFVGGRRQ
jgi:hypothetical protein